MVNWLAHKILYSPSFSRWFPPSPLIFSLSRPKLYHHLRTRSQVIALYLSMPWSRVNTEYSIHPGTAYTEYSIHRVQHTPSTAYTEYSIHPVQHTPSTAYTQYNIHPVQHTPSTTYTQYSIHRVQHTPSTAYTEYCIHCVLASSQDRLSPAPSQSLISRQTMLYWILYIPTITS